MLEPVLMAALLVPGLAAGAPAADVAAPDLAPCAIGTARGRCGTIQVPEIRTAESPGGSDGRHLDLFVAVVPATADRLEDPIVILEGGPGASVTRFAALHVASFAPSLARRDLLLLDQRGTGRSGALDCDLMAGFTRLPTPESAARCRDALAPQARLEHYTTSEAVADLAAVLDRLGYARVNLFAASNGTRTALRFLAEHPHRVRSAILLAPYPTTRNVLVEAGRTLDGSLRGLVAACASDAACAASYPELGGLIDRVAARHRADPLWPLFASGVRMMLFFPLQAGRVPQLLDLVHRGGRLPEPTRGPQDELLSSWISQGAFMSVLCAEDAARTNPEAVRRQAAGTFLGPGWAESLLDSCAEWPRRPLPEGFERPVASEVPALLLVGGLDPAMPAAWAHETAATLPRARVVEVPQGQHSFVGMTGAACVVALINDLVAAGSAAALDASCVETMRRPEFAPPAR